MLIDYLISASLGWGEIKKPAKTAVTVIAGIWFNQDFLKIINHHLLHSRRLHCWDNELPILLRSHQ